MLVISHSARNVLYCFWVTICPKSVSPFSWPGIDQLFMTVAEVILNPLEMKMLWYKEKKTQKRGKRGKKKLEHWLKWIDFVNGQLYLAFSVIACCTQIICAGLEGSVETCNRRTKAVKSGKAVTVLCSKMKKSAEKVIPVFWQVIHSPNFHDYRNCQLGIVSRIGLFSWLFFKVATLGQDFDFLGIAPPRELLILSK